MSGPAQNFILDAHVHHWSIARGDYGWLTPALKPIYRDFGAPEFAPLARATGVEGVILVQAAPTEAETFYLLELAQAHSYVKGVVGWTDFARPDAAQNIAKLAADPKLVGLRPMIQDIADDDWMLRPELAPSFEAMMVHGLSFDALVLPRHLKNLQKLIRRYPQLKLVIDHGAKPPIRGSKLHPWKEDIAACAAAGPVLVKLSGLLTEAGEGWKEEDLAPYITHLYDVFGFGRLTWGSDWPVLNLASDYVSWFQIAHRLLPPLDKAAEAAVFGGNAARFYGVV